MDEERMEEVSEGGGTPEETALPAGEPGGGEESRGEPGTLIQTAPQQAETDRSEALRREAEVREFMETFPEAAQDPRSIPPEVWAEVRNGRSLVAAYGRYSAARVRAVREAAQRQEAARRLNGENMARSTGSMRSAGEGSKARDPFLEGWEE